MEIAPLQLLIFAAKRSFVQSGSYLSYLHLVKSRSLFEAHQVARARHFLCDMLHTEIILKKTVHSMTT